MPDTFTQLYIQIVFAVKFRAALIAPAWKDELLKYTTAVVQGYGHKMIRLNSMPDHIHILIGLNPDQSLSELVRIVKVETSKWIKSEADRPAKFAWQSGYGAFSYSRSDLGRVIQYIINQEQHHKKVKFLNEYGQLLKQYELGGGRKIPFVEPM